MDKENNWSLAPTGGPPVSWLVCVVCSSTPWVPPLHGCEQGHLICGSCRELGGILLSCPLCGSQDLQHRLPVTEELLKQELEGRGTQVTESRASIPQETERRASIPQETGINEAVTEPSCEDKLVVQAVKEGCPLAAAGCTSRGGQGHSEVCLYRKVVCPKALFSHSCSFVGSSVLEARDHGRTQHGLQKKVTCLSPGFITSKMFDRGVEVTCCDDSANAKFQPLELTYGEDLFYCYFERVSNRKLWFFFIRMYGGEVDASGYLASIMIGSAALGRGDSERACLRYQGSVATERLKKEEIRKGGLVLAVADEVLKACKVDNVLFRVWFRVERI